MRRGVVIALALAGCARGERAPATDTATAPPAPATPATPAPPVASASCAPGPLTDSSAGPLRLGMLVAQVTAACPGTRDTTRLADEGQLERVLTVPLGADSLMASIVDGRVWRIAVTSPGPRTADALGVGTPAARLRALPGARGISGEGRDFIIADVPCGMSFQVERDTVRRVLVTGCP